MARKKISKDKPKTTTAAKSPAKASAQPPEAKFKFVQAGALPDDSFADGAASLTIGRGVLKLDLYRVIGVDRETQQELRTVSHRIVLPLSAVSELNTLFQRYGQAVQQAMAQQQAAADKNS